MTDQIVLTTLYTPTLWGLHKRPTPISLNPINTVVTGGQHLQCNIYPTVLYWSSAKCYDNDHDHSFCVSNYGQLLNDNSLWVCLK